MNAAPASWATAFDSRPSKPQPDPTFGELMYGKKQRHRGKQEFAAVLHFAQRGMPMPPRTALPAKLAVAEKHMGETSCQTG